MVFSWDAMKQLAQPVQSRTTPHITTPTSHFALICTVGNATATSHVVLIDGMTLIVRLETKGSNEAAAMAPAIVLHEAVPVLWHRWSSPVDGSTVKLVDTGVPPAAAGR